MTNRFTLQQLSTQVDACPVYKLPRLIQSLRGDPRRGAHRLADRAMRRWNRSRDLWSRFQSRFRYERRLWQSGYVNVAGVDEVGRGPLAGPVVAAAVVLDPRANLPELNDSKVLSAEVRGRLDAAMRDGQALSIAIGMASVVEINQLNIFHASQLAMLRAVRRLNPRPDYLLVDGVTLRKTRIPQQPLVGGDSLSNSIAAASVVAKVYRDQLMINLDRRFPGYGFAVHKGYPTPDHRLALRRLGPSPIHRTQFRLLG